MRSGQGKVTLIALGLVLLAAGAWWGIRCYQGYQFEAKWDRVESGMTKAEVKALLGEPTTKRGMGTYEEWVYPKRSHHLVRRSSDFPFVSIDTREYGVSFWDDKVGSRFYSKQ